MQNTSEQKFDLDISGMSCASCVGRVERALKKVEGVENANVNLATERANVNANHQVKAEDLIQAVTQAGYSANLHHAATAQHIQLAVEGMTCASCVGRVERALKKVEGVENASVNLATERADVDFNAPAVAQDLITAIEKAGYGAQILKQQQNRDLDQKRQEEAQSLYKDLIIAVVLAAPVFVLEMGGHLIPAFHHWIMANIGMHNSWLLQFVLATLVLIFPGRRFYKIGIPALFRAAPDMNSLVAVGTLAAYSYSVIATFLPQLLPEQSIVVYYESAVVIIALILFGRYLEAKAKGRTTQAIQHLIALQPKIAHRKNGDHFEDVEITSLQSNDIIMIKPGEKIPTDGTVIDGSSYVDESMMTGEPIAVAKTMHDQVIGGTVNQQGSLTVKTTAVGEQTVLAQIINMVEQAQGSKLPIQTLVDRITLWFVPAVMLLALITFFVWLFFAPQTGLSLALVNAVAVLIIACPCAMGLATPTSIMVGTGRAAEMGVLFRQGEALQRLKDCKVVAFDKTGTLTLGQPQLTDFMCVEGQDETNLLRYAASLESQSEHPIADAVVHAAKEKNLSLFPIQQFQAIVGSGIEAQIEQHKVYLGAVRFMQSLNLSVSHFSVQAEQLANQGKSPFYLAIDNQVLAILAIADPLKPDSPSAIQALHTLGLKVAMISGDNKTTAENIAAQLGIDTVIAEVLPEEKVQALTQLKQQYGVTAFVGDGINDAPALASADIGIAIGTGTDVAIETADVVLMSGSIQGVVNAFALSQATIRNIKQNLFWAFAYNVALIPIAAGILYPVNGTLLSPMFAAAAMALSSTFVLTNALRLKRIRISQH
ncbi:heavy metal translocating P-type ATPase [Acinetobacter puyangensis]|uniref:P-type Cu(2+) transporter n=1 Tax=Acinetobacter puyangensis TaxID=1096779 RepID=A0A240EB57_9GAMM|nr:heavy metal translocating P-type ATPase [Acinetobacter puyangensis]SNX45503.1 Cu+-exporting ATPase/Au+-exporting ATPase [Acinetobacter puyangensis]